MMLKAVGCLILFAAIGGATDVLSNEVESSRRLKICLNGDWLRCVGKDGTTAPENGWETLRVPEFHANALKGSAWFRLDLAIPEEFGGDGRRILLEFVRVRHYARVFLNAQLCGENYGARAPFQVDITQAAKVGEKNRLEVWVHECSGAYSMPGKVVEDLEILKRLSTFERYRETATISEDVFLVSCPLVHVSDILVMPSVREKSLSVRFTITNSSRDDRDLILSNGIFLVDDKVMDLPEQSVTLEPGKSHTLTVSAPWDAPELWGYPPYGEPVLYHLETQLRDKDGVLDRLVTRFGFREIWTEEDKIIFNGKPLRILGYWMPEGSGRSVWTWRMAAIQWAGCNAVHNHAEQREPAFYEVADELGMLVWDADFCGGPLGTTSNMSSEPFADVETELTRQYPLWAKAIANHPSTVILMMGCLLNNNQVARLAEVYRNMDPTRLLHGGGDVARPPMHLAAYASKFDMFEPDPIRDIREGYTNGIGYFSKYEGKTVPVINKEIWYNSRNPETDRWENVPQEKLARATRDAILFLAGTKLAGFILYSQQGFRPYNELSDGGINWPGRSGESQHPTTSQTGGMGGWPLEFANFFDPEKPAFEPLATAKAMRESASEYIGHQVPVAKSRRPEVIVTVSANDKPLPDAYVYAVPIKGAPGTPMGMRTDKDGTAWFALREPGLYQFTVRSAKGWQSVELDAPLQPIDIKRGGLGTILRAELTLNSDSAKNSGPPFPRIANCYGSGLTPGNTAKDIDEIARTDLLIGGLWCNWNDPEQVKKLHERMAEVRKKNPDIIILDFSVSAPYASPEDATFPESGWLKQPDGRYIDGWPGTRMINLLKPEAREWVVEQCVRSIKERGLNGVFIDCMAGTFDWWACNIASREPYEVDASEDGQPDDRDWLNKKSIEAKTQIARQVREAIGPDVPFMTNQGGEWSFSETNGVLFEDNLDYVLDGKMSWEDVLKPYLHWTETTHRPNVTTIVSSSGIEPPFNPWKTMTHEEREALLEQGQNLLNRMRFGLTTTLMGDGYFAYDLHTRWRGQRWWYPEYDAPLGYPRGKAEAQADGTWRREFDGGTVIVNPTVLDARIHFDELRLDVSSGKVDTEFIVPAYDGRLLVNTEEGPKPGTMPDPDPLFTLSGPGRIVQREGKTLCRFDNAAAYFDAQGQLISLTDGGRNFAVGGRAVLVSDNRWIDFGYEDSVSRMIDDGKVQFSGNRVQGDVRLSYEQTVSVDEDGLMIQYRWKALTDGNLHAWRQQLDFPARHYAGGHFSIDNTVFELPAEPVKGRISDHGARKIVMIHPSGAKIVIETSIDTILQDERMYNGREYRVLLNPVDYGARPFKAGDTWEYTVHLKIH